MAGKTKRGEGVGFENKTTVDSKGNLQNETCAKIPAHEVELNVCGIKGSGGTKAIKLEGAAGGRLATGKIAYETSANERTSERSEKYSATIERGGTIGSENVNIGAKASATVFNRNATVRNANGTDTETKEYGFST